MKDFLSLSQIGKDGLEDLLALASRLEKKPEPRALEGKVLALLFLSPSLRTLTSFQAGAARLGGASFVVSQQHGIHGLEMRPDVVMDGDAAEHIREALPVIASYGDALGLRAFAPRNSLAEDLEEKDFLAMAKLSSVPVINMESAVRHPCQSLADWKTLEDLSIPRKSKFVLSWAYHPKALPLAVAASTLHMAAMRGMNVTVLRPEGFELPETLMRGARHAAEQSGGSVSETDSRGEALEGAEVIYAKSWASTRHYSNDAVAAERELRRPLIDWRVEDSWFETADTHCRFMHCLPVRRGVVVSDSVLEGSRSVVLAQAKNRMFAQMAVLHRLLCEPEDQP